MLAFPLSILAELAKSEYKCFVKLLSWSIYSATVPISFIVPYFPVIVLSFALLMMLEGLMFYNYLEYIDISKCFKKTTIYYQTWSALLCVYRGMVH